MSLAGSFEREDLLVHPLGRIIAFANMVYSPTRSPRSPIPYADKFEDQIDILETLKKANASGVGEKQLLELCKTIPRFYNRVFPLLAFGLVRRQKVDGEYHFYLKREIDFKTEIEAFSKWLVEETSKSAVANELASLDAKAASELGIKLKPADKP